MENQKTKGLCYPRVTSDMTKCLSTLPVRMGDTFSGQNEGVLKEREAIFVYTPFLPPPPRVLRELVRVGEISGKCPGMEFWTFESFNTGTSVSLFGLWFHSCAGRCS